MNLQLENKTIDDENLFVIAEVGNQFAGSKEIALKLVDVCAKAGADAIKFIFWFPDEIMTDRTQLYSYETAEGIKTEPMFDLLERLRLPLWDWFDIRCYCKERNIIMMSTVNSPSGIDYAREIDMPAYKLSSWDYNFPDIWRWIAGDQKPVFIDTGPVNALELAQSLQIFKEEHNDQYALLYCFHTSRYEAFNMRAIPYLKQAFHCLVGYSSTNYSDESDIMAVSLGACILEKRLTLSRKGGILHDAISKEPHEFGEYVLKMRNIKSALGQYDLIPSKEDLEGRQKWFRKIVADKTIPRGTIITRDMLEAKRGTTGIDPKHIGSYIGREAKRDIQRNEDITEDCI